MVIRVLCAAAVVSSALLACGRAAPGAVPSSGPLAVAESLYADLRDLRDRIDIRLASAPTADGSLTSSIATYNSQRRTVATRLAAVDSASLSAGDARALGLMRRTLLRDLDTLNAPTNSGAAPTRAPDCSYDASTVLKRAKGLDSLRGLIYACYAWAQSHVVVGRDTLDRLTVLGSLPRMAEAERRRELFLALDPVWRTMNRGNTPDSPYRQMIAAEVRQRKPGEGASIEQMRASGLPPDSLEQWLREILSAWREGSGDSLVEPWNWFYGNGRVGRLLSDRIPKDRLLELNRQVYRSLGADLEALDIHFDVEPRAAKDPVAYTTFGARPRFINGGWRRGEPWIFATYRTGGLDNLNELLHETGHAIHIAAIRTRPAYADWPDSDPFTEAVADFIALQVYEPAWQQRWLGDSVSLADGLRARYGGIVLDVAWALFEVEMQRDPAADPNQVWARLTGEYLRIRPHPELSWWAMRGQLIDAPGYMMNYAAGAILIAAIRQRTRELHGSFTPGDSTWYRWIAPRLYRYGLERPTRQVLEDFLGGSVSPAAILQDMRRANQS